MQGAQGGAQPPAAPCRGRGPRRPTVPKKSPCSGSAPQTEPPQGQNLAQAPYTSGEVLLSLRHSSTVEVKDTTP